LRECINAFNKNDARLRCIHVSIPNSLGLFEIINWDICRPPRLKVLDILVQLFKIYDPWIVKIVLYRRL